jgi:hypothetical protein
MKEWSVGRMIIERIKQKYLRKILPRMPLHTSIHDIYSQKKAKYSTASCVTVVLTLYVEIIGIYTHL